jgi:hypothetical protein
MVLEEIKDLYDAEQQLTKALPKMAKAATNSDLRAAVEAHLEETRGHVWLEQFFDLFDERPKSKHCGGIAGISLKRRPRPEHGYCRSGVRMELHMANERVDNSEDPNESRRADISNAKLQARRESVEDIEREEEDVEREREEDEDAEREVEDDDRFQATDN